jgi:DNA-binding NarL/FixJ family response regulator
LDTLDYYGSNVNRDFIRDAVNDRLLEYADTCSNDLVAAYARLRAGQDPQRVIPWSKTIVLLAITSIFILVVTMLIRRFKPTRKDPVSELTIQERKIYAFLKEGKSNKEIADECAVSVSTVKSHVNSIYSKLGVKSRKDIADF